MKGKIGGALKSAYDRGYAMQCYCRITQLFYLPFSQKHNG